MIETPTAPTIRKFSKFQNSRAPLCNRPPRTGTPPHKTGRSGCRTQNGAIETQRFSPMTGRHPGCHSAVTHGAGEIYAV
jgi:hypothetical protein